VRCVAVPIGGETNPPPAEHSQVARRNSVFQLACSAAAMAAVARNSFTLLAVPISRELSLSMADIGAIQSALLTGYLLGQMPAGHWADKFGGPKTLMMGLLVWSVFGSATMAMPLVASPVAALLVLRGGLGLGQSVLMPAISATAAQNFSAAERGDKTSGIYACYSLGTVLGLVVTPLLAEAVGWMGCVVAVGIVGIAIAVYGLITLGGSAARPLASPMPPMSSPVSPLRVLRVPVFGKQELDDCSRAEEQYAHPSVMLLDAFCDRIRVLHIAAMDAAVPQQIRAGSQSVGSHC
jgi:MFS family permease